LKNSDAAAPAVSVVVPVYNGEKTIERALVSILAQTFTDFEIIVIDDGSTDLTVEVISRKFGERVQLIKHPQNRGAAAARNTGIAAARGRWIAFLDSDDEWKAQKLARQLEVLENAGSQVKACAVGYQLHRNNRDITFNISLDRQPFRHEILFGCTISPGSTLVVERGVFDEIGVFDEALLRLEDWDWLLRFASRYEIAFVPVPLADIHLGERTHEKDTNKVESALNRIRSKHLSRLSVPAKMQLHSSLLVEKAALTYRAGHSGSAMFYVVAALTIYPFRNMAFFRMLWRSLRKGSTRHKVVG
jgi:glycosyltransferase involved in cell wall biosynthesis